MSEEIGPGAGRTSQPEIAVITERIAALDRHFSSEFSSLKELLTPAPKTFSAAISSSSTSALIPAPISRPKIQVNEPARPQSDQTL